MPEADLDEFIEEIVSSREKGIVATSRKIDEVTWNLPTSIYFVVTVITTIGNLYSQSMPLGPVLVSTVNQATSDFWSSESIFWTTCYLSHQKRYFPNA